MSAAIPFHKQSVGRTFTIAITVLGLGAVMQFCAMTWLFFTRYRTPAPLEIPAMVSNAPAVSARDFTDPFAETTPAAANLPATTPPPKPKPEPITTARTTESMPVDRLAELIEQGKMLRERSEYYASVTKLREAEAMAEQNPQPTAELAITYEKMGFAEKAAECWKRIYEMGEAAGVYYAAAEGRLKQAVKEAVTPGDAGTPSVAAPIAATAVDKGETVGLNANCKLGLLEITRADEASDANTKRKFVLHVPVKARPRARIDVHDVTVQVMFYDIVNGKALDRTNATVSYKWSSPPADWADDDVEGLEVTYQLPELRVADEDRKFYGYLVSVYYKNALQDYKSDPPALAQKAVPPAALAQDAP